MNSFPTNPALETAIVAATDEDVPRLVYADWLDEHGDPDRAEFIRIQCRLADLSPAESDWVDLTERQAELVASLKPRRAALFPSDPEQFYFGLDFIDRYEEPFRRGFPYFTSCQVSGNEWTPAATQQVGADLTRLVETTTIRGFHPYPIAPQRLTELLAVPAFAQFTGLSFQLHVDSSESVTATEFYQQLAHSPAIRRMRHLTLFDFLAPEAGEAIAAAESFDSLRRLEIRGSLTAPLVQKSRWVARLRHLRIHLLVSNGGMSLLPALGELPDLHTLDLPDFHSPAAAAFTTARFPALGKLTFGGDVDVAIAEQLATARFPRLAVFEATRQRIKNDSFQALLQGDWFAGLRSLNLQGNAIGDRAIATLGNHPVAKQLRVIRLGDNAFGKGGLSALAKAGAFPELTTLDLNSSVKRKAVESDLVAFLAALAIPGLRYLNLDRWPLGKGGAKAIASNPALANLTRLSLSSCEIGDVGAKALLESPHLQNLVELRLDFNGIRNGSDALADAAVMPRLGECWMTGNKIPKESAARIKQGRYVLI